LQAKEAKRLKEFLEDYDDDRDDPKYYRYVFVLIPGKKIFTNHFNKIVEFVGRGL